MTHRRPGFTIIELIAVITLIGVLIALLLPAVQSAREAARRAQCVNNLIQIGIALKNYESSHRVLPPGVVDFSGPVIELRTAYQFGWITQILPYLEQKNVYRNLDFKTGIYQLANMTARSIQLNVLICPSQLRGRNSFQSFGGSGFASNSGVSEPATSNYAACHHDLEAPIDIGNKGVFFLNSRVRSDEIEDGLSHTIFLGETLTTGDELGWASGSRATLRNTGWPINLTRLNPLDLTSLLPSLPGEQQEAADPTAPPPKPTPLTVGGFGSSHPSGANFGFGDGSVRFLRSTIDLRVYRLLGNRADGEPVGGRSILIACRGKPTRATQAPLSEVRRIVILRLRFDMAGLVARDDRWPSRNPVLATILRKTSG